MEYLKLIKALDNLRKSYPKVYREYLEAGREYRKKYAEVMLQVFSEYASQAIRDNAVQQIMENDNKEIVDRWQKAEMEYQIITNESRTLYLMGKLLMSKDQGERWGGGI